MMKMMHWIFSYQLIWKNSMYHLHHLCWTQVLEGCANMRSKHARSRNALLKSHAGVWTTIAIARRGSLTGVLQGARKSRGANKPRKQTSRLCEDMRTLCPMRNMRLELIPNTLDALERSADSPHHDNTSPACSKTWVLKQGSSFYNSIRTKKILHNGHSTTTRQGI